MSIDTQIHILFLSVIVFVNKKYESINTIYTKAILMLVSGSKLVIPLMAIIIENKTIYKSRPVFEKINDLLKALFINKDMRLKSNMPTITIVGIKGNIKIAMYAPSLKLSIIRMNPKNPTVAARISKGETKKVAIPIKAANTATVTYAIFDKVICFLFNDSISNSPDENTLTTNLNTFEE